MVVSRRTILMRNIHGLLESGQLRSLKLLGFFLALFAIVFLFSVKIVGTINKGLETQEKISKINSDISALEKENTKLKYESNLYQSDSEVESQYRALENKKKKDEIVYIVPLPTNIPRSDATEPENVVEKKAKIPNWQKWVKQVF